MADVKTNATTPPAPNGLAAASASALATSSPTGNALSSAMKSAEAALKAALLPAGRCNLAVTDVSTGDPTSFVGWSAIRCGCPDAGQHGELALFVPSYIDPRAIIDDGNGGSVFDPELVDAKTARGIVGGLKRLHKLCGISGIDPATIADADDMALLIGIQFEAVVAIGRDRDDLPTNTVRSIIGPVKAADAAPAELEAEEHAAGTYDLTDPPI